MDNILDTTATVNSEIAVIQPDNLPAEQPKRSVGRPRLYTPEELSKKIDEYFTQFNVNGIQLDDAAIKVPTISGLCVALNTDRQTLFRWANEDDTEYSYLIKNAKTKLSMFWETMLMKNASGAAFWLRNQGWDADRQTMQAAAAAGTDQNGQLRVIVTVTGTDGSLEV